MEEKNHNNTLLAYSQSALRALSGLTDSHTKPLQNSMAPTNSITLQFVSKHAVVDGYEVADIIANKESISHSPNIQSPTGKPILNLK